MASYSRPLCCCLLQVLPVLFAVVRVCDEPLRELLLEQLVVLVMVVRQHIRRFLPDLLGLLGEFWGISPKTQHTCLKVRGLCGWVHPGFGRWGQRGPGRGGRLIHSGSGWGLGHIT